MNRLDTILVLGVAFLGVFCQAAFGGVRHVLGAQIDLLPPLMAYASLAAGLPTVMLLALFGGLWFDSLSGNPLGVSVLPLFLPGFVVHVWREVLLREQPFAQVVVGLGVGAAVPVLTLILLLTTGHKPLLGWGTFWQLAVLTGGSAALTPPMFVLFGWLHRSLAHSRAPETSFRADHEMRRGR